MSDSITLHEILSQYRKSDLVEIAKLHHLHGYSQYKKAQMVEFLCRALLDADVMRKYFMYLIERSGARIIGFRRESGLD